MNFAIILKYISVSILISLIFGLTVSTALIIKKVLKKDFISSYLFQLWSLILFIIILIYYKLNISIFNTYNLFNCKNILLFLISIVSTSAISYQSNKFKPTYSLKLKHFLDGASMEIPQRLLAQNLFVTLGINMTIYGLIPLNIILNAIIWIQFIIVQEIIQGRKISTAILPKIIASFWFSICIGILYKDTGNIVIPMIAHGLQRVCTYKISEKFGKLNSSKTKIY